MFGAAAARLRSEIFRELATLVKAGITVGAALTDLGEDLRGGPMGHALVRMGAEVSDGMPLAAAMRQRGDTFSPVVIAMIQVGEEGGRLDEALQSAADYYQRDFELRHLLTRELAYPFILLLAIIFIPAAAQFVMVWLTSSLAAAVAAGALRLVFTLIVIGVPAGIIAATVHTLSRSEEGRARLDGIKLRVPVIGGVVRRIVMARFCRALASLYSSGVMMGTALRLAAEAAGNAELERELKRVAGRVDRGERLSVALEDAGGVPRTVIRMIRTGEDSGEVDRMAENIAGHFEMEAETAIKQMAVTITPVAVLIAAVIVGVIFIGGFMNIYASY
ncbi:MAG: type II secretion system F family protein [Armatimonadetes bacterium]|nr:type II secretion system F family protein [Armatimonadota bacterium]